MGSHDCIPSPVYPGLHAQALCYNSTSVINDHILCHKLTNPGPVITHLALRSQPPLLALTQGSNAVCNNNAFILFVAIETGGAHTQAHNSISCVPFRWTHTSTTTGSSGIRFTSSHGVTPTIINADINHYKWHYGVELMWDVKCLPVQCVPLPV